MAIKTVNDNCRTDRTRLNPVSFRRFPSNGPLDPPAPSIAARAMPSARQWEEVRRFHAQRALRGALNTRNGPDTFPVHVAATSLLCVLVVSRGSIRQIMLVGTLPAEALASPDSTSCTMSNT